MRTGGGGPLVDYAPPRFASVLKDYQGLRSEALFLALFLPAPTLLPTQPLWASCFTLLSLLVARSNTHPTRVLSYLSFGSRRFACCVSQVGARWRPITPCSVVSGHRAKWSLRFPSAWLLRACVEQVWRRRARYLLGLPQRRAPGPFLVSSRSRAVCGSGEGKMAPSRAVLCRFLSGSIAESRPELRVSETSFTVNSFFCALRWVAALHRHPALSAVVALAPTVSPSLSLSHAHT